MTPTLDDFFSDNFREQFANRNVDTGSVIRCEHQFHGQDPKQKRFIVVGKSPDVEKVATVVINTIKEAYADLSGRAKESHLVIDGNIQEYLDRPSNVDGSRIRIKSTNQFRDVLLNNSSELLGTVSAGELEQILNLLRSSRFESRAKLREFGIVE